MPCSISRVACWCSLLALVAAAEGCQRGPTWNLAPVEGTVVKDGRPLAGIEVTFLADADAGTVGPRAKGITDESGHYRLQTDNGDDGAVIGKHRVVLLLDLEAHGQRERGASGLQPKEAAQLSPQDAKRSAEQGKMAEMPGVPAKYRHFNDTPLRVEVRPGSQVIDLEVK
jgi:hypothetical protein